MTLQSSADLRTQFKSLRTRSDVAALLGMSEERLIYLLYRVNPYSYRTFKLSKRSGGLRDISAPPWPLKVLQRRLSNILNSVYDPPRAVHGFVPGRSIVSNAQTHVGKRWILNIDLKDFFPSIHFGRVQGLFSGKRYNLPSEVSLVLAQICTHNAQLPQGAPTSPIISNMICNSMDYRLAKLARELRCNYSRYADDISFSTNQSQFPQELAIKGPDWSADSVVIGSQLNRLISGCGFVVNGEKKRLQVLDAHQEVTGLTVNQFPNVSRKYVRQIRAMLHAWGKFGYDAAEEEFLRRFDTRTRRSQPSFAEVVKGKIMFLRMVKGHDDGSFRKFARTLHRLDPDLIEDLPESPPYIQDSSGTGQWVKWFKEYSDLVYQMTVRKDGKESSGTAFAFSEKVIGTAGHTLVGQIWLSPPFADGQELSADKDTVRDESVDVGIIPFPSGLPKSIPIRYKTVQVGEQIAAIGYATPPGTQPALGLYPGIVESKAKSYDEATEIIHTTIDQSGGLSGSPVIDRGGKLIGIVIENSSLQVTEGFPGRIFHRVLPVAYLSKLTSHRSETAGAI